jgi:hypothetical protein
MRITIADGKGMYKVYKRNWRGGSRRGCCNREMEMEMEQGKEEKREQEQEEGKRQKAHERLLPSYGGSPQNARPEDARQEARSLRQ